jgi:CO/xanthine dehydrogenase FAD-binding subunit
MVTFYRRLPKFDHIRPNSMEEAIDLLNSNTQYRVYAGGTDLIPRLKSRVLKAPDAIIDLKGIPDLDYIRYDDNYGLRIGALTTIRSLIKSEIIKNRFSILHQAAASIASTQVQNRGTIGGNICNAVPSADSAPALLCLDATLLCVNKKEERSLSINDFFKAPMETSLASNEILKEIQIPASTQNSKGVYIKLTTRGRMDLAIVGVAILITFDAENISDIKIGLGAVAPTPVRAIAAEKILRGRKITDELIISAAQKASEESSPIDDHRASAEYRKMMVEVLVKRGINQIISS